MIAYHPDSRFLTDFATANLPLSEAVCVSAHLEFCGKCRAHVKQLSEVGAILMAAGSGETVAQDSFERLMSKIDGAGEGMSPPVRSLTSQKSERKPSCIVPRALKGVLPSGFDELNWVQLGSQLRVAPLTIDSGVRETALYDIRAGGRLPEHEHRGEEITVLLKGSFSDAEGSYSRGDFVVRNKGEAHQPTVTQDMDCICLVSLERPVKPRSWFYRLLEPYVQHRLNRASAV